MAYIDNAANLCADVDIYGSKRTVFISIPDSLNLEISNYSIDPFVTAFYPEALFNGEPMYVEGRISRDLLLNLQMHSDVSVELFECDPICIVPDEVIEHKNAGKYSAAGFSTGVDSFYTLQRQIGLVNGSAIDFLLFANIGSHGTGETGSQLFQLRFQHVSAAASAMGLRIEAISTNIHDICNWPFELSYAARYAAIAQALGLKRYLLASTHNVSTLIKEGSNAAIDHLLGNGATTIMVDGSTMTRPQKLEAISKLPEAQEFLHVCTNPSYPAENCSSCAKCLKTIAMIRLLSLEGEFSRRFDFDGSRQRLSRFLAGVRSEDLGPQDIYLREILELARLLELRIEDALAPRKTIDGT